MFLLPGDTLLIERWDFTAVLIYKNDGKIDRMEFENETLAVEYAKANTLVIRERIGRQYNGKMPSV